MIKVLVYGDSNVWGDNFITKKRIPDDKQWSNILQKELGSNYKILQEGLPGRLAGNDEIEKKYKNGKDSFISTFRTNAPIDYLIISLGTNDLQLKYNKTSKEIINDLLWYKETIDNMFLDKDDKSKYFNNKYPKIIYILPVNFDYKNNASFIFDKNKELERQEIVKYFNDNKINNIYFNDIDLFEDGIHLNYEGHKKIATRILGELNNE